MTNTLFDLTAYKAHEDDQTAPAHDSVKPTRYHIRVKRHWSYWNTPSKRRVCGGALVISFGNLPGLPAHDYANEWCLIHHHWLYDDSENAGMAKRLSNAQVYAKCTRCPARRIMDRVELGREKHVRVKLVSGDSMRSLLERYRVCQTFARIKEITPKEVM